MLNMHQLSPVAHGMRLGVKLSLVLTSAYLASGLLILVGWQLWLTQALGITQLPILRFTGLLPFFFLLALVPALVLGALTGGLIGELWLRLGHRLGVRLFTLLGLVLCSVIILGLHSVYRIQVDTFIPAVQLTDSPWFSDAAGFLLSYPFLLGIPSVLYILAGTWGSYCFWRLHPPG